MPEQKNKIKFYNDFYLIFKSPKYLSDLLRGINPPHSFDIHYILSIH
jgi:hypothetical protein